MALNLNLIEISFIICAFLTGLGKILKGKSWDDWVWPFIAILWVL